MARGDSVEDFIIDFSKEESGGGGGIRIKPGTYPAKITASKAIKSEEKGTPGLELWFTITDGKAKGKKIRDRLWATPKAYSRFRTLLEACGKKVPAQVNLVKIGAAVKGSELYIEIDDEERDGYKTVSRVSFNGFINPDDAGDDDDETDDDDEDNDTEEDDDEDEAPAPKAKKGKAKKGKKKPTDDDEEDVEDIDLDEL
jgi:hypothetical protein